MKSRGKRLVITGLSLAAIAGFSHQASAQLNLTAYGSLRGFTISMFADKFPSSSNIGPLGIGFNGDGSVIVSDYPGNVRVFATDTDGQHANLVAPTSSSSVSNTVDIADAGGKHYITSQSAGTVRLLSNSGVLGAIVASGMVHPTGLATNPNNGHLFVSTYDGGNIWDLDPIAQTFTTFKGTSADGLSTDGTTLYAEVNGHILGYNIATTNQVFDSGFLNCGADGTALGSGSLAGYLYVNCNNGLFKEIKLSDSSINDIANGGTRGDFVRVDPNNGTLLITQSNEIDRLIAPSGGGFGETPEPGVTASLIGVGVCASGLMFRKRARK
ncbi:MAG: hypothetical protein ABJA67_03325 [Chthonomonadales bacterium]